jgi:hypothetical protein
MKWSLYSGPMCNSFMNNWYNQAYVTFSCNILELFHFFGNFAKNPTVLDIFFIIVISD